MTQTKEKLFELISKSKSIDYTLDYSDDVIEFFIVGSGIVIKYHFLANMMDILLEEVEIANLFENDVTETLGRINNRMLDLAVIKMEAKHKKFINLFVNLDKLE